MADLTLSDGREIEFDLDKITLEEYRALFDKKQNVEYEDGIISRASGLSEDEFKKLTIKDYKRICVKFYKKVREPLADPS